MNAPSGGAPPGGVASNEPANIAAALGDFAAWFEGAFEALIPAEDTLGVARVCEAMRYGALGGGKRFRPFLVVQSAGLFGLPRETALPAAAAVECIHCYSLIHDDLPAMDDDALRRGRPTAHIAFDEATAILAGDGLLTRAFGILAEADSLDPDLRLELTASLARAAGSAGMIGGQMRDIEAEGEDLALEEIMALQAMKTGALIGWSAQAGAVLARAQGPRRSALSRYARNLGLVFQITDDLLDFQGDAALLGKAVGKDADAGKGTFVARLGPAAARRRARDLTDEAIAALDDFGGAAATLRALALFVLDREK